MIITYLFRSPGTGHSIEELFGGIQREAGQETGVTAKAVRLPHMSRGWRSVWQNLQFVKRLSSDIFHITGDVHYIALALPASRTVLTIHDCSVLEKNRRRPVRYALFWLLWYYLPIWRAAVTTVISEKTRQDLLGYVGQVAKNVRVVPNGYDPAFAYHPRDFCRTQPVLLQIGTALNKNLSRLIEAIEGITCTLVIVGPLTKALIHDLQQRRIYYRNHVDLSRSEIVRLYNDCDIVTFVSTYEGFGMPLIEANAIGRAVITSAILPLQGVANGAAHLVDPTNTHAIRQGILRLIQDDTYREDLITAGLKNALTYTLAATTSQYLALYHQLFRPASV